MARLRDAIENIEHFPLPKLKTTPVEIEMNERSRAAVEDTNGRCPSILDESDQKKFVVLIVANNRDHTAGLVEILMRTLKSDGHWVHRETAANEPGAGVQIYDCGNSLSIIDTLPLRLMRNERSPSDIARRWLSRNCLRRLVFGKEVVVICVVSFEVVSTPRRIFSGEPDQKWMGIFRFIFEPMRTAVITIGRPKGEVLPTLPVSFKNFVREKGFIPENLIYDDKNGDTSLETRIEDSLFPYKRGTKVTVVRYSMCRNTEDLPDKMKFIWGPERVILFGRSGSGKSTLAQMLTLGKLDPMNELSKNFVTSQSMRGETKKTTGGTGRGWYVLDTPGFGEPKCGSICTRIAAQKIQRYVMKEEGTFAHYLFVVKGGRLFELDEKIWTSFVSLFGEKIKQNFSVVISGVNEGWVERNRTVLEKSFTGCKNFFSAEFPENLPEKEDVRNVIRNEAFEEIRMKALRVLEEQLSNLKLTDKVFAYGRWSKMYCRIDQLRADTDLDLEDSPHVKFRHRAACYVQNLHNILSRSYGNLLELLRIGVKIKLPEE